MYDVLNAPRAIVVISVLVLWLSANLGAYASKRWRPRGDGTYEDLSLVLNATLTLLGLIIAFSFSMAIYRYDQRKNYEEEEANAIGTEYLRAELLPAVDIKRTKDLLRQYLDQRILFYEEQQEEHLPRINARTRELQRELWSVVQSAAASQPSPPVTLAAAGMNDVLNSEGYSIAAWRNRIPEAAWMLMATIALCSCALLGYTAHHAHARVFAILAIILSISFYLLADIDSPRGGLVRVHPLNLMSLADSIR